jgi:branched-chain amino acid transport system substrate-binding protein
MSSAERVSRREFLKYVATGVVCAAVAGAGGWFAGRASVPPPPPVKEEKAKPPRTIKIGATVELTGAYAPSYKPAKDLYDAWVPLINKMGGIYVEEYGQCLPVEVIYYDDKSDAATVTKFYEKLIVEDKVDVLVGPGSSVLCMPAASVAEKYGVPLATGPAGAPAIYEKKNWVVSVIPLLADIEKPYFDMMAHMAKEGLVKTAALVSEDSPFGKGLREGALKYFPQAGVDIVYDELIALDTKDFTPTILKLKDVNADVIFASFLAPLAATFIKQAYEQGLRPKGAFCFTTLYKSVLEAVGPAANYWVGWYHWLESFPYEGVWGKRLWLKCLENAKIDNKEYPMTVLFYNCLEALCAAIRKAGTLDKAEVMKALKSLSIQTVCGPLSFTDIGDIKGIGTIVQYPVQYVDGKYIVLWPPEVATGKYIYPMPKA